MDQNNEFFICIPVLSDHVVAELEDMLTTEKHVLLKYKESARITNDEKRMKYVNCRLDLINDCICELKLHHDRINDMKTNLPAVKHIVLDK